MSKILPAQTGGPEWNDLFFFTQVALQGGFAAASRVLGVPKSRLSRRVAELENQLGVRLLQRTTRRLALTDVGQRYLQHCQSMLLAAQEADDTVRQLNTTPRGPIRVSCPVVLSQTLMSEILPKFMKDYPEVTVHLESTNRRVDLIEDGVDVAIRVRTVAYEDASLVMRSFGHSSNHLFASPAWIARHGTVTHPTDLTDKDTLSMVPHDGRYLMTFEQGNGGTFTVPHKPKLITDDLLLLRAAAVEGVAAGILPSFLCNNDVANGRLKVLLPEWPLPKGNLHVVFPTRRGLVPAVRVFIDCLACALPALAGEVGVSMYNI
ncbi:LysR substrate-binding domain-containing protein [Leeia oryzae]|uniref:LysR substrate-binding domain-containing protein n=1 Tax=Leeia oryzae TaxID=356662 RepID=UPI00037801ED|nr:LysR substrate-binding domain-containing protein [Leeia oryzae]